MSADHARHSDAAAPDAIGGIAAQNVISGIREGNLTTEHAWFTLVELASQSGHRNSPACRAFVIELAKRAAAA